MRVNTLLILLLATYLSVASLAPATAAPASAHTPSGSKKKNAAMPKFIPNSSHETARERERRLLRECKGRPNAGACAGFAS